jgi:hypothetical protein
MLTELLFGEKKLGRVGVVQFDATISETHTNEVEVTSYPVEEGADRNDHIRKLPRSVQLEGVISDTPIVFLSSFFSTTPVGTIVGLGSKEKFIPGQKKSKTRVDDAYNALLKMQNDGAFVDVSTTLAQYDNMVIKSISVTRDASKGKILSCQLSLQEVLVSKSASIDLPDPEKVANKKKKSKGKKKPEESTPAEAEEATTATDSGGSWGAETLYPAG